MSDEERSEGRRQWVIGREQPEHAQSEAGQTAEKGSRRVRRRRYNYPISNFYPGYADSAGRLDRIEPISSVQMQRVLPRYDFSTARTRTSGLGPPLIESPVSVEITGEGESPIFRSERERREPPPERFRSTRAAYGPDESDRNDETAQGDRTNSSEMSGRIIDIEA